MHETSSAIADAQRVDAERNAQRRRKAADACSRPRPAARLRPQPPAPSTARRPAVTTEIIQPVRAPGLSAAAHAPISGPTTTRIGRLRRQRRRRDIEGCRTASRRRLRLRRTSTRLKRLDLFGLDRAVTPREPERRSRGRQPASPRPPRSRSGSARAAAGWSRRRRRRHTAPHRRGSSVAASALPFRACRVERDRRRAARDLAEADVEQPRRCLEHRQPDHALDQVAAREHDEQAQPSSARRRPHS